MATAGIEVAAGVVLFGGVGWVIDLAAGTYPWGLVTGCILGALAGTYLLIKTLTRNQH